MLCKGEGEGIRIECCYQGYENIVHSAFTNLCMSLLLLSRVLWYVFTAHRHKTSLRSSGEEHKLRMSTSEGPLFTHIYRYTILHAWTHPLVWKCEQIHLLHFFP